MNHPVTVGTRVIVLQAGAFHARLRAGIVIEERAEPHLKQFVVRCDNGAICYVSGPGLALEGDPLRRPCGPRASTG